MSLAAGPPTPVDPDLHDYTALLADLADAELVRRFAEGRDDAAFTVLVQRHGALVLGVCRRVLGHAQDAEDAFQATFLILARKARAIRRLQSLGSWLYKVAYRTALRARANQARRKARESNACEGRAVLTFDGPHDDVGELLDEEVRRLPEKYRVPVLLCYLQGRTNEEAARQLHCPTGTLKIRLLRARELLRRRLSRRGVALSLAVLLTTCLEQARAGVPEPLLAAAARAGSPAAAGISPAAVALAERILKGMVLTKVKVGFAVLLTVLLLAFADGLTQQARATTASREKIPAAKPTGAPRPTYPDMDAPPADEAGERLLVQKGHPRPRS
jgi:RNA polymerase sigma factor (sigma-70 family)